MVDINEIYSSGGNFLKTQDVQKGSILEVTIKNVEVRVIGSDKKLVLELDSGKSLVLNTTNARSLAESFLTPDYTKWVGKKFKIFRTMTQYQGSTVECLRVV